MPQKSISADERRWRAQDDARTMAQYQEIMGDSSRRKAAVAEARKMSADLNKRAAAMSTVAKSSSSRKK